MADEQKKLTLAELVTHNPPYDSTAVLATFKEYAESGAAVLALSVQVIIERTQLTRDDLYQAKGYLLVGQGYQTARFEAKAAVEYELAVSYLDAKIKAREEAILQEFRHSHR